MPLPAARRWRPSHLPHPPMGRRGFTLVEVLVALAVVAVALGAGLKAAGALTDNAQRLGDVSAAHWCADNALTGLRLARQFPGTGDSDFDCNQLGRSFRGRLQSRATPNPNFRRVDAVVLDDAGHVLVTLSTVVGRY
jgi:general secretion pathway protein I